MTFVFLTVPLHRQIFDKVKQNFSLNQIHNTMERDFTKMEETMQQFREEREEIKDRCSLKCAQIQLDADTKKNQARSDMGEELIILAKRKDAYMNDYREWKRQQHLIADEDME